MQIEVILVITASNVTDPANPSALVVPSGDNYHLPRQIIGDDETSLEVADHLLQKFIQSKARIGSEGWVELIHVPVVDNVDRQMYGERCLAIPYGCILPKELQTSARWVSLRELLFDSKLLYDHQEIFLSVCQRF